MANEKRGGAKVVLPNDIPDKIAIPELLPFSPVRFSKLEKRFIQLIRAISQGEITDIWVDAYDDGFREARVRWRRKA